MSTAGRPPSPDPKGSPIPVRLDLASELILNAYCEKYKKKRTQAIRDAVHRLGEESSQYFWTPEWRTVLLDAEEHLRRQAADIQASIDATIQLLQDMRFKIGDGSEVSDEDSEG